METFVVARLAILVAFVASVACTRPTYFGHSPDDYWGVSVHDGDSFLPEWVDVGIGATVRWTNYGGFAQVLRSGTPNSSHALPHGVDRTERLVHVHVHEERRVRVLPAGAP